LPNTRVTGIVIRYLIARVGFHVRGIPNNFSTQVRKTEELPNIDSLTVTIVIPTRDRLDLLKKSVTAVKYLAGHENYNIVILNNNSVEESTLKYFDELLSDGVSILDFPGPFNYAKMHNEALFEIKSDFIFFLNNDAIAMTMGWLASLLRSASGSLKNSIVGVHQVGVSNRPNHDGIYVGKGGFVRQIVDFRNQFKEGSEVSLVQAVSFSACLVSAELYKNLEGLDEKLSVGLNDVDFCLRARRSGTTVVLNGGVTFKHEISASRGSILRPRNFHRAILETIYFAKKWGL
jgi:GT2 family glycosyltransferase